ncbi:hypothetical protein KM910_13540 [Virgibacillus pantothenticus]|uniref:hypothetical protein n=1 Tax=Virgibacillus pantothenticus TaxID=1473 RepID=UPI001C230F7C|nr:hypothetical protein [Virgibacillus pantothenticus]MBU8601255.1 hypothetical protein [Virgibacillus pantothenticus]MBU8635605.1 hypothetical protein [Virgibacillus pantothenticus]MBU8665128.1 hypothetical protein [Virgibacillus pantothenticus]MEB5452931.1 hypothetical protein [Virgibacillus pantothenticus]MEB5461049.1 hypothetical protein [Virgibacillus pantothenticus]
MNYIAYNEETVNLLEICGRNEKREEERDKDIYLYYQHQSWKEKCKETNQRR